MENDEADATIMPLSARQVPQNSLLGSVHIPVSDSLEEITDELIMEITIPCGITLGGSGTDVAASIKKDQDRAREFCATEAS